MINKNNKKVGFYPSTNKGAIGVVVQFLIDGAMFASSGKGRVVEMVRDLNNLRLVNKEMKECVDYYVKDSKRSFVCGCLEGKDKYVRLRVMYALKYKVARDRFMMISKFGGRGEKFKEVLNMGTYGIMLWMCQFGEKRERAYGEEKMDSRLLAICDKSGKKVEDVSEFVKLFQENIVKNHGGLDFPEKKFDVFKDDLKKLCKIKTKKKDKEVVLKKNIEVFSKMVLGMMEEYDVVRKEELRELEEEKKKVEEEKKDLKKEESKLKKEEEKRVKEKKKEERGLETESLIEKDEGKKMKKGKGCQIF